MLARNIKANKKTFFAYVRSKTKCKVTTGPLLKNSGEIITDLKETADTFNQYCKIPQTINFAIIITNIIVTHRNAR